MTFGDPPHGCPTAPVLRVLICTDACPPSEMVAAWIRAVLPAGTEVDVVTADRQVQDLRQRACDGTYGLCLLTLNNIFFPAGNHPGDPGLDQAVQLVGELRKAHDMPIICFSGWLDTPQLPARCLEAGADFFFPLPVPVKDITDALRQCLKPG